jgi:hypothetical protein
MPRRQTTTGTTPKVRTLMERRKRKIALMKKMRRRWQKEH